MILSILDRIEKIRISEGLNKAQFEAVISKSSGYINTLRKNGSLPGSDVLIRLSENYPKYNMAWLMTGKGEMLKQEPEQVAEEKPSYPNDSIALVRSDIQNLSNALAQPLERLSDGMFKLLLDQQKILRVAEDLNLDRLNKIGDKLEELLKQ